MMRIRQIPILADNYCYLLINEATKEAGAVDPAEAAVVARVLEEEGLHLRAILCTHHHWDHSGGNLELLERFPGVEVIGGAGDAEKIPGLTRSVSGGEALEVAGLGGRVLDIPCHTRGHVAYLFGDALFSGDTLFVAGCGRFFEGDAAQMHQALNLVFAALPKETRVFCGHEYTISNLAFALSVEPENEAAREKLRWAEAERAAGRSTVPSTLGEELGYNPFMRVSAPSLQQAVGASDPVEVMARLRQMKNEFR